MKTHSISSIRQKKIFILFFVLLIILLSIPACTSNEDITNLPPIPDEPKDCPEKLGYHLWQLVQAEERGEVEEFAHHTEVELVDGSVRVIIECVPGQVEAAAEAVGAYGIVELTARKGVQAVIPITSLIALAEAEVESIQFIRLPVYAEAE